MIVEAILDALQTVLRWIIGLIPSWSPPSWLTDSTISNGVTGITSKVGVMGAWFPFALFLTVGAAVLAFHTAWDVVGLILRLYGRIRGGGGES